ncbi:MAG TPA: sigma-54 dependent transcriptional regulator [Anaerolineales bacterium]|nr:sigma-54 dependent transcriptional regulator [Anaerolineales bacterium]
MPAILIVEDEDDTRENLQKLLMKQGYEAQGAPDLNTARQILNKGQADIVILDVDLGGESGIELLKEIKLNSPDVPVIMNTGNTDVMIAVQAMRLGARDYIQKPLDRTRFLTVLERAVQDVKQRREIERMRSHTGTLSSQYVMGDSAAMKSVLQLVERAANLEVPVLLTGESGTGKEIFANLIHQKSKRKKGQFVAVNCGALSETLLETTLFGHESGAFTSALKRKIGYIEHADQGTLFLDEISAIKEEASRRLLRVLETKSFERVGGETNTIKVDFRLIAASNRDLFSMVNAGQFREDMLWRLRNGIEIRLPSLRERPEDIPVFVYYFLNKIFMETGYKVHEVHELAMEAMQDYPWYGNLRELHAALMQASFQVTDGVLEYAHLPQNVRENKPNQARFLHQL